MKKLPDNQEKYNQLEDIVGRLKNDFNLTPRIGVEIEFYLRNISNFDQLEKLIGQVIKPERGGNQYEIDMPPSIFIVEYASLIKSTKEKLIYAVKKLGGEVNFDSKPFANDYGNSLHVHLDFLEDTDVEKFARILCHYLARDKHIFLPKQEDKSRLDHRFMAPTHICYGGNNRTVAVRIPDSLPKRIEHRVSSADADPALVIYTILSAIYDGMSDLGQIGEYNKIYGNAFDNQYNLKEI